MDHLQLEVVLAVCAVLLVLGYLQGIVRRYPLPPGPMPLPIIGNMLDMPHAKPWETYTMWGKKYGDIVHIKYMGTSFVILNTFNAACDLFEKRSSIYSDRSKSPILDLIGISKGIEFQQYGPVWRKHRALYHKQLNPIAARAFQPMQLDATRKLLRSILETPEKFMQHLLDTAAGTVINIAYGYEILPNADPFMALAERTSKVFSRATRPGAYLVNFIPSLRHVPEWMPGAKFQQFVRESRKLFSDARDVPFDNAKRRMKDGIARPCFVSNTLMPLGADLESSDEDIIRHVASSIFGAGSDTTFSSLTSFVLAMVLYPAVQRKAQIELDSVLGSERLPEFHDRSRLPYIEAIVKEVLRWHPVLPTGLPHCTTQDDVYHGYHIPKGAVVIGNAWNMLHDPEMYPDPSNFRPERFLPDESGRVAQDPAITGAFGFGRRICAGRHLADASLWIGIASLLAAFDISPAINEDGHEVDVHYALDPPPGLVILHPPFPCSIKARSPNTEYLIKLDN